MSELFSHFEPCREEIFTKSLLFFLSLFSEALGKMKDVYEKNPQMGDPASLAPQINQTSQKIEQLRGDMSKYEVILSCVFFFFSKCLQVVFSRIHLNAMNIFDSLFGCCADLAG